MFSNVLGVALALTVAAGQIADAQGGQTMRFQGMDRNNDGRITRQEWNGSDQSFKVHDWNGDGVLSGDEVRPGGRRAGRQNRADDFNEPIASTNSMTGPCVVLPVSTTTATTRSRPTNGISTAKVSAAPITTGTGRFRGASSSTRTRRVRTTTGKTGLSIST